MTPEPASSTSSQSTNNNSLTKKHQRRASKKSTRFCTMIAGQCGIGKSSLLATLFDGHVLPPPHPQQQKQSAGVEKEGEQIIFDHTKEMQFYNFEMVAEDGQSLCIEAIDTPGYGDDQSPEEQGESLRAHLESTFDQVFQEEQRIHRNPKFEEHRVHVLFYLLEMVPEGMKSFDVHVLKAIHDRVNVIPLLAKADGLDASELSEARAALSKELIKHEINCFDVHNAVIENEGEEAEMDMKEYPWAAMASAFPHPPGKQCRKYPWGTVMVNDPKVCNVSKLFKTVTSVIRDDLIEGTVDDLYEKYRTEQLLLIKRNDDGSSNLGATESTTAIEA